MASKRFSISKRMVTSIFIVAVMVFSTVAYAAIQAIGPTFAVPQNPLDTTYFVNRTLTAPEKVYILRTGRMLIENLYNESGGEIKELQDFVAKHPSYVFLEQAQISENETVELKVIGIEGKIKGLDPSNITESSLFDLLCEFGMRKPIECTLREM